MSVKVQNGGMSSGGGLGQLMGTISAFGGNSKGGTTGTTDPESGLSPTAQQMLHPMAQQEGEQSGATQASNGFLPDNPQMDAFNAIMRREQANRPGVASGQMKPGPFGAVIGAVSALA